MRPLFYILVIVQALSVFGADYYEVLGVPRDADDGTIKRAYRKLSLKLHPGVCPFPLLTVQHGEPFQCWLPWV